MRRSRRRPSLDIELEDPGDTLVAGVDGELMQRAIGSPLRTCVLTTPVHPQAPDVEAALRLLEAVDSVYDLDVDSRSLEAFAAPVAEQYGELAARLGAQQEAVVHDDRMST